jgi:hypothetical protein
LLIVGCFLELISISILVPVLMPIIVKVGIDPVHFGVMMTLNLMIGLLHPPLGMVLFVLSRIAKLSIERTTMAILPWLIPLLMSLVAITLIPELTLWLPRTLDAGAGQRRAAARLGGNGQTIRACARKTAPPASRFLQKLGAERGPPTGSEGTAAPRRRPDGSFFASALTCPQGDIAAGRQPRKTRSESRTGSSRVQRQPVDCADVAHQLAGLPVPLMLNARSWNGLGRPACPEICRHCGRFWHLSLRRRAASRLCRVCPSATHSSRFRRTTATRRR